MYVFRLCSNNFNNFQIKCHEILPSSWPQRNQRKKTKTERCTEFTCQQAEGMNGLVLRIYIWLLVFQLPLRPWANHHRSSSNKVWQVFELHMFYIHIAVWISVIRTKHHIFAQRYLLVDWIMSFSYAPSFPMAWSIPVDVDVLEIQVLANVWDSVSVAECTLACKARGWWTNLD